MAHRGKKYREKKASYESTQRFSMEEALELLPGLAFAKFDETVDVAVRLGVDPKRADQMVRGTVALPHGLGKEVRVAVFAKGEKEKEAREAGADHVGGEDLAARIKDEGWLEFDKAVATPDMMGQVGKLGRVLGPRGLMPNAKVGTVTFDVGKAVNELKAGKVDFRVERAGIVHAPIGRVSFGAEKLKENLTVLIDKLNRMKPSAAKGTYFKGVAVSTSMGPGVKLDTAVVRDLIR